MDNTSTDSIAPAQPSTPSGTTPQPRSPPFQEQPPKLKGRHRLLAGLQRISSSPSVARLSTTRSKTYNGAGRGSVSCISLNSSSSAGLSFGSPVLAGYASGSATPLVPNTPGVQILHFDERVRVRWAGGQISEPSVPLNVQSGARLATTPGIAEVDEDYLSRATTIRTPARPRENFNFWRDLPSELRMEVLTYLSPREIIRCALVAKAWHAMCFDGQLWSILDTAGFYQDIPATALVNIIAAAGPFVRDLNLRGCVQLRDRWSDRQLSDACHNLESFSLEGCRIDRGSLHNFLWANRRLVHLNFSGLAGATDAGMAILGANCPRLEHLNVSWCRKVSTAGLRKVVEGCPNLKDLRAREVTGWEDLDFMQELFERNGLKRLVLMNCDSLNDESLAVLIEGRDSEVDVLSSRPIVPPRKLKHLDLTRCRGITDQGLRTLVNNLPEIEGLQLAKCHGIVDSTLTELLPTTPMLTHLDLEELEDLTNQTFLALAHAPCAKRLRYLNISYCENVGDTGMIPVLKACTALRSLEMDNTRIGDLVLAEAAAMVRRRSPRKTLQGTVQVGHADWKPASGLKVVAYDCPNVTWTGVREILSRNADLTVTTHTLSLPPLEKGDTASGSSSAESLQAPSRRIHIVRSSTFPSEVIQLKCFYTYQSTVEEHTKRVQRGDFVAARRLERKWAEFMMAQEEAGAAGAGSRRRRRRAREAQMMHADEEDVGASGVGVGGGRRRRARSGGCAVM